MYVRLDDVFHGRCRWHADALKCRASGNGDWPDSDRYHDSDAALLHLTRPERCVAIVPA